MPLSSADRSFGVIALQRKYVTREILVAAEKELDFRRGRGLNEALADYLLANQLVSARHKAKVERIRAPHGRHCHSCARVTFLLPGENDDTKACEHCGGRLRQRAPEHVLAQAGDDTTPAGKIVAVVGGKDPKRETELAKRLQESSANLKATLEGVRESPAPPAASSPPPPPGRGTRRLGTPSDRASPASAPAPASADRFAPPPEPGDPPPSPPTRRFAIAGLSTPVPGDGVVPADVAAPPPPEPGFMEELAAIFGYPFLGLGAVIITIPAVLRAVFFGVQGVTLGLALSLLAYVTKATLSVVSGDRTPPPRPGLVEMLMTAHIPVVALVACFGPFLLVFSSDVKAFFASPDEPIEQAVSIGNDAHTKASKTPRFVGLDASDVVLKDLAGRPVRLGDRAGRWLVLGLLSGRETTTEQTELARKELEDLGRLAEATDRKDSSVAVDVAAVFIDPEDKLAREAHPARGAGALRILRTRDAALPPPLEDARPSLPTVFVIGPRGEVKAELDRGASDEALFGALLVLQRGGKVSEIKPSLLPGRERAFGASGISPLAAAFFFLGVLYFPMALLMTAYGDPVRAFRYHEGVRSILQNAGDYAFVHAVGGACAVVALVGRGLAQSVVGTAEARTFVTWWLGVAGALATSAALGRYFVHNSSDFSWAKPRTSPMRPAAVVAPPAEGAASEAAPGAQPG